MSRPRFAAITSDLLARKGEARPWEATLSKQSLAWQASPAAPAPLAAPANSCEPPAASAAHVSHAELKKIGVRLTHHDYERLGILAVKRGTTRQRLLQGALDNLLAGLPLQYPGGCACLGRE
jgi:hypothetical protein